ncbi:MAG: hydrogenase iron-sulfur subunit [Candidatus Thermoplasmatota archaeon]
MKDFEPKIVAFLCNWCSYAAADLSGTSRLHYPPNIRVIRTMCSGRVNPAFVMLALKQGADGVIIAGCHPGDCHYIEGNYHTQRRFSILLRLLEFIGVDKRRVRLAWASAAEGVKFAQIIKEVTDDIKKIGPMNGFKRRSL